VEKPKDNGTLRLPRYRWEDNIKMYLKRVGWEGVNYTQLAANRDNRRAVMEKVINL